MPAPYGVTDTGFSVKTEDEIQTEFEDDFRGIFGQNINLTVPSRFSMLAGIGAERFGEGWEALESVYASRDPDTATGQGLDQVLAITGSKRKAATASAMTVIQTGVPGTVLPAGRVVSTVGVGDRFATEDDVALVAADARVTATAYDVDDFITNSGQIYVCITAGTTSGGAGPASTADDITDGTAHWRWVGEGTAYAEAEMEAEETGPKAALSGVLTRETPVSGWLGAMNLEDATVGTDIETNAAARLRREQELLKGESPLLAIVAAVRALDGVTDVVGFENTDDEEDGDGLPGHAIEILVDGGDDDEIREAIFSKLSGGIEAFGTETGTVTDSEGHTHAIAFSRPEEIEVWVTANFKVDASEYPDNGDDLTEESILTFGNAVKMARDISSSVLSAQVHKVDGPFEVTSMLLGTVNPPVASTTLVIGSRQRAKFDSSRIVINSTPATP